MWWRSWRNYCVPQQFWQWTHWGNQRSVSTMTKCWLFSTCFLKVLQKLLVIFVQNPMFVLDLKDHLMREHSNNHAVRAAYLLDEAENLFTLADMDETNSLFFRGNFWEKAPRRIFFPIVCKLIINSSFLVRDGNPGYGPSPQLYYGNQTEVVLKWFGILYTFNPPPPPTSIHVWAAQPMSALG